MDPSLPAPNNDPHHPPPPPFPAFNNNQLSQPPPHQPWFHPPYSEMICYAIAELNELDGSRKQAISRYIEKKYTAIPPAHGALMTHHLKSLTNHGVLVMVKKSYKLAPSVTLPPRTSVAVWPPRSELAINNSVFELQPLVADLRQPLVKRPSGRSRKDGALPTVKTPVSGGMICCAIAALNEPEGSSKQAISRYNGRTYTGIPPAHGALMTHHFKSLKSSGVLVMVKKSYKLAHPPPPQTSVAVAASGPESPRSDLANNNSVNENPNY